MNCHYLPRFFQSKVKNGSQPSINPLDLWFQHYQPTSATREYNINSTENCCLRWEQLRVRYQKTVIRVAEHVPEVVEFVRGIIKNGSTGYEFEGSVYFDAGAYPSSQRRGYAQLEPWNKGNRELTKGGDCRDPSHIFGHLVNAALEDITIPPPRSASYESSPPPLGTQMPAPPAEVAYETPPVYVLYVAQASTRTMLDMNSLHVQHQSLLFSFPFTFSLPTLSSASVSSSSADEKSPRMSISSVESVSSVMMLISSASDPFSGAIMQASPTTLTFGSASFAHSTQIASAVVISHLKTSYTTIDIPQEQGPLSDAHPQSGSHDEREALIDVLELSANAPFRCAYIHSPSYVRATYGVFCCDQIITSAQEWLADHVHPAIESSGSLSTEMTKRALDEEKERKRQEEEEAEREFELAAQRAEELQEQIQADAQRHMLAKEMQYKPAWRRAQSDATEIPSSGDTLTESFPNEIGFRGVHFNANIYLVKEECLGITYIADPLCDDVNATLLLEVHTIGFNSDYYTTTQGKKKLLAAEAEIQKPINIQHPDLLMTLAVKINFSYSGAPPRLTILSQQSPVLTLQDVLEDCERLREDRHQFEYLGQTLSAMNAVHPADIIHRGLDISCIYLATRENRTHPKMVRIGKVGYHACLKDYHKSNPFGNDISNVNEEEYISILHLGYLKMSLILFYHTFGDAIYTVLDDPNEAVQAGNPCSVTLCCARAYFAFLRLFLLLSKPPTLQTWVAWVFFTVSNSRISSLMGKGTAKGTYFICGLECSAVDPSDLSPSVVHSDPELTLEVGTKLYIAPEVQSRKRGPRNHNKADMYRLGIAFFKMNFPFSTGVERMTVLEDLRKPEVYFPRVISALLHHDPAERPTALELSQSSPLPPRVEDEYFKGALRMMIDMEPPLLPPLSNPEESQNHATLIDRHEEMVCKLPNNALVLLAQLAPRAGLRRFKRFHITNIYRPNSVPGHPKATKAAVLDIITPDTKHWLMAAGAEFLILLSNCLNSFPNLA
ncbi:uncharacterized protein F5147DRAFT_779275 [Suillus discolor]|uniref:Protein kinase domain-containing protein n=1 Tax=Suillus discolor TaxID=1912936 RepID=A0A9P7EXK0_9AGAM|nr:uncharacterized protein F5147DRAFT_779275 [Suillus discolor]KAG2093756.1 hypothetical protein F5147DRAFT_779275 [Suillus discolor]